MATECFKRVNGETIATPAHNYFNEIADTSETAWQQTLEKLYESQQAWLQFLEEMSDGNLEEVYPSNAHSYADHIHGILQHDAYHLGQIVMLAKHLR